MDTNVYKRYDVYCNIITGLDDVEFLVASFYKKEAANDYVDYLNDNNVDLFVIYTYEEVNI